jgi:hypothetical protein
MANRYTIGSGVASSVAIWDGGASVPVEGDRVLICSGHTVTLDGDYTWGDDATSTIVINSVSTTRSINVFGTLAFSQSVSSSLTSNGHVYVAAGGHWVQGSNSSPIPAAYTANLFLNKSGTLADNKYYFMADNGSYFAIYGSTKKRIATLTAAVSASDASISVLDATGWQVGDELHLPCTSTTAYNEFEQVTISAGYVSGDLTVPVSALSYAHKIYCPVGNTTSNANFKNYNASYRGYMGLLASSASVTDSHEIGFCTFDNLGVVSPYYGFSINQASNFTSTPTPSPFKYLESICSIVRSNTGNCYAAYISGTAFAKSAQLNGCLFVRTLSGGSTAGLYESSNSTYNDCLVSGLGTVRAEGSVGATFNNGWFAHPTAAGFGGGGRSYRFNSVTMIGRQPALYASVPQWILGAELNNCDIAETFSNTAALSTVQSCSTSMSATLTDCYLGTMVDMTTAAQVNMADASFIKVVNKNRDVTLQEEWYKLGVNRRDNSTVKRSLSSMKMNASTASTAYTRSFKINIANGETVRLIGYCQYDSTYYNGGTGFVAPTMILSGTINGTALTPVVHTATSANAGNWELIDKSITNSTGAAGQITVTYSIQTAAIAGAVYWDGIVDAPMVEVARHYGFNIDDGNPKRTVNISISASEATAAAYTGMAVTGATSAIAISADQTFQSLYDYTQAWSCLNLAYAVPVTGVGAAGNIALTAIGNVTISDGYVLNGSGSISMGSNTLSTEFAGGVNYTFTGGAWSQTTTVPSFSGGQVNLGAAGAYAFSATSAILGMTPSGVSTYVMSGGTFAGTIDLRNTTAYAITVRLPAGTTTTTANNTGGTITVDTSTIVTVAVAVAASATGSPIQNARVYLIAAAGGPLSAGTVILSGLTDASGVYQDTGFVYSSAQPVTGHVRKATGSPLYKTADLSGSITAGGYAANVLMIGDE